MNQRQVLLYKSHYLLGPSQKSNLNNGEAASLEGIDFYVKHQGKPQLVRREGATLFKFADLNKVTHLYLAPEQH